MVSGYCGRATAGQVCVRTPVRGCALPRREDLIDAVEARTFFGRNKTTGDFDGFGDFHLRFQRTLPSFASSIIIPRSASSLRMRSAVTKSRFFFAALRSATSLSISVSPGPLSGLPNPSARSFSPSLSSITAKTLSNVARNSCAADTSPCRNSPLSIAMLASRTRSNTAARARAVFKSSESPASNSSAAFAIRDRKSTRLNSSHGYISYAVFCLKKKNRHIDYTHAHLADGVFDLEDKRRGVH